LVTDVVDLLGDQGLGNALSVKLLHAIDQTAAHPSVAINQLNAFIQQVDAQAGKKLTTEEAAALIASAEEVIDLLEAAIAEATDQVLAELTEFTLPLDEALLIG
jgi:hypothetical protein